MAKKKAGGDERRIIRKGERKPVTPKPRDASPGSNSTRTHAAADRADLGRNKKVAKIARKVTKKVGQRVTPGGKPPKSSKMVFAFGGGQAEGDGSMADLLGAKGANLAEMVSIGLPVPPGFTITTETCELYYQGGKRLPHGLMNECHRTMAAVQKLTDKVFGDLENPLLVSVRSGARVSMPGMMDTVLNLGLNDESVHGLARSSGDRRFAFDAYRRLVSMFGSVVMGVDQSHFDRALAKIRAKHDAETDADIPEGGIVELAEAFQEVYRKRVGDEFPQNPFKQLELAIEAVFKSWNSDRAIAYRRLNNIVGLNGTAVTIQAMVSGNMGAESGTGVAFTRNPSTGENKFYGEFLVNAQGEDVVSGARTPRPMSEIADWDKSVAQKIGKIKTALEKHYKDVQDIEFTVERGELWMLQTRTGKRTGAAAVRIACDMVKEKLITEEEALLRVPAADLAQVLTPAFDGQAKSVARVIGRGLPASPGAVVGKPAFSAAEAVERTNAGETVVLVRPETSPEDIEGMHAAAGVLTTVGGITSHAAVVARGWGTCCVVGAGGLEIDEAKGELRAQAGDKARVFTRDDVISLDGSTGEVMQGAVATVEPELSGDFAKIMRWADKHRRLEIRAIADSPDEAREAKEFGAASVGLFRVERLFVDADRIDAAREAVLAASAEDRRAAEDRLVPGFRDELIAMFETAKGAPVTIRFFDPPLRSLIPEDGAERKRLAKSLGLGPDGAARLASLAHEINPLIGTRGARLGLTHPELLRVQIRALAEATIECLRRKVRAAPELVLPMLGSRRELAAVKEDLTEVIHEVRREADYPGRLDIKIGVMVEAPRAAVAADELVGLADLLVFDTDDLTQLALGFSSDDSTLYLPAGIAREVFVADPFERLDEGVARLIELAVERGRGVNDQLKLSVTGAHASDAESVRFFHRVGLDAVCCPPRRVPIARLAAAQAALLETGKGRR